MVDQVTYVGPPLKPTQPPQKTAAGIEGLTSTWSGCPERAKSAEKRQICCREDRSTTCRWMSALPVAA